MNITMPGRRLAAGTALAAGVTAALIGCGSSGHVTGNPAPAGVATSCPPGQSPAGVDGACAPGGGETAPPADNAAPTPVAPASSSSYNPVTILRLITARLPKLHIPAGVTRGQTDIYGVRYAEADGNQHQPEAVTITTFANAADQAAAAARDSGAPSDDSTKVYQGTWHGKPYAVAVTGYYDPFRNVVAFKPYSPAQVAPVLARVP